MSRRRIAGILVALWLLSGVYIVRLDEQALVLRFGGVVQERVPPGIHLALPWGMDRVYHLKPREQKRLTVGFELPDAVLGRSAQPLQREYFTGDQNLVNVELLLQYVIREPRAYLFGAANPTNVLRQAAEAAVVQSVGSRGVDSLLTTGRLEVQNAIRDLTQRTADRYGLGISITAVSIQGVAPPVSVADAFRLVSSAREDRDRLIHEAESYASAVIPAGEAEADRMEQEALGYRTSKVLEAEGDASRFVQAYQAYKAAPDVTRARLYLETMDQIIPKLKVYTVDRDGGKTLVDLNLIPRPSPSASGSSIGAAPQAGMPAAPAPPDPSLASTPPPIPGSETSAPPVAGDSSVNPSTATLAPVR